MGRITHLCISDLHTGAPESLATALKDDGLTPDPTVTSPVAAAFGAAVRSLLDPADAGEAPTLVLLGDMLEMAFADRGDASNAYLAFLAGLVGDEPIPFAASCPVLPGNHDHALWTSARLAREVALINTSPDPDLPRATTADPTQRGTENSVPSPLMTALHKKFGFAGGVEVYYPNMMLRSPDGDRLVILHHGHFCDPIYRAMSNLQDILVGPRATPISVADLADENANWIDFGWSSFGQATTLSRDILTLYSDLQTGKDSYRLRNQMAAALTRSIREKLPMGGDATVGRMLRAVIATGLGATLGQFADEERGAVTTPLGGEALQNLLWYLQGPVARQEIDELKADPPDRVFVYGHTHKPWVDWVVPEAPQKPIRACNMGGWYLDTPQLNGVQGVSVVLIDEARNVVSVRAFSTPLNGVVAKPKVELVSPRTADGAAFAESMAKRVDGACTLWARLGEVAAREYRVRQQILLHHIKHAYIGDRSA